MESTHNRSKDAALLLGVEDALAAGLMHRILGWTCGRLRVLHLLIIEGNS